MKEKKRAEKGVSKGIKVWSFPVIVVVLYAFGFMLEREKTLISIDKSAVVFKQILIPLCLAFVMMILLNRFLPPSAAVKYLGKRAGFKGLFFSSLSGMVSMGPIYSWYPLLNAVKEKGASTFHIANFMAFRSVKPVLLPILLGYFGWLYTSSFLLATVIGSLLTAWIVSALAKEA